MCGRRVRQLALLLGNHSLVPRLRASNIVLCLMTFEPHILRGLKGMGV